MQPINILVDSFADEGSTNAQMINGREIVTRLDPDRFFVTMFLRGIPDEQVRRRPNTRLIHLPGRLQTIPILAQFLFGNQHILFYMKGSPASRWYLKLRSPRRKARTIGSIESQTDWRDDTVGSHTIRLLEETTLRCDYLFSNSEFVKRSLEKNYGIASEVIPTGVDTDFLTPDWDRPRNPRPRVLYVGALRSFKGPQVVVDAARRHPDADFVIVGDGVMAQELRQATKALSNVTMLGSIGRRDLREEYRAADIFLFPSRWEGSPRVLMEAAACGLPVIARKDYQPESVVDGRTGFLGVTDEELITRLGQLLAQPDLCRTFGKSGRAHMARFSWDVITRQWESVFTRLAQPENPGRDRDQRGIK